MNLSGLEFKKLSQVDTIREINAFFDNREIVCSGDNGNLAARHLYSEQIQNHKAIVGAIFVGIKRSQDSWLKRVKNTIDTYIDRIGIPNQVFVRESTDQYPAAVLGRSIPVFRAEDATWVSGLYSRTSLVDMHLCELLLAGYLGSTRNASSE